MAIEIDFGRELGRVAFPDDVTDEQAQSYVRENYQAIRQGLISRRQEELAAETEVEEKAKFQLGQYDTVETVLNTLSELPRGAIEGFGQTAKAFARTFEAGDPFTETSLEEQRSSVAKSPIFTGGQAIREFGKETYPGLPGVRESLPAEVLGGMGSTVSTLPFALIAGPAAPISGGIAYGLQAGESALEEADTTINRRIAEAMANRQYDVAADLQDRREQMKAQAFITAAPIGAITEGVLGAGPKVVQRLTTGRIGGLGTRLAERLVPKSAKFERKFLGVTGADRVRGAVEATATEFVQESAEQLGGNIAAGVIYDPERGLFDGVARAGFVGSISGGVFGGLAGSSRDAKLASAANEALGGDPANPLPRANATVAGLEDTQQEGEPEITAEDVMRTSQEAGLAGQEEEVIPASKPQPKSKAAPVTPKVDVVRLDDLRKKANAGTINPDELAELTLMHQTMGIPDPVVAATPATPTTTPTPAAATVDAETGLDSDEQDELDQLITAEDEGLLSEQGAITLAAYRARLGGVEAVVTPVAPTPTPVATPVVRTPAPTPAPVVTTSAKLPKDLAGAKPRYNVSNDAYLPTFDSDFDRAAYIVTQANPSKRDADYLNWAVEASGMTPNEVRKHGLQVRLQLKQLAAQTKGGTAQKPATLVVPAVRITMPEVKVTKVQAPAPVAAKPVAKPVAKPAEELTEKQYYDQRVKEIADANSIGESEVRDLFSQEDANLEYWQLIQKAAESGKQFKSQSLDRLPQARVEFLRRNFPQSIPQGYFYPGVVKTIAPAPTYTLARINKLLQSLKARATAVGKGLYEIKKLAPGQRLVLRDSYGRLQETDQFQLREKSEVTGNVYDEGFILRDKQEARIGQAPRPAPTPAPVAPAPVAPTPAPATSSDVLDQMTLWRRKKPSPLKRAYGLNPTPEQAASHKKQVAAWEKEYRRLGKLYKTLEQEKAQRAAKVRPASPGEQVQPPAAAGAPMQEGIDNIKFVSEPVAQALGGGMDAKDAKAKLVQQLERAVAAAPDASDPNPRVPKVTIEIPGDGTYTVSNTKQALNQVLAKAHKLNTSTAKGPVRAPAAARKPERANEMLMRMAKQAVQVYGKNAAAKLREQAKNRDLDLTDEQRNDLKVVADMITPVTAEPVVAEPTEAELEAAEEARLAQAEEEIDAGPIGQAKQKLEDEGSDMKKSQVKAMARKLEKAGVIDDSELDDEGRDTEVDELVGQLLERIEEARDNAIQEREQELADEAKVEKVAPKPAPISKVAQIISKLENLKVDTGGTFDAVLGIPALIWNGALITAQNALRAGKAVTEAIDAAIEYIRTSLNEKQAARVNLDAVREQFETDLVLGRSVSEIIDDGKLSGYKQKARHLIPEERRKLRSDTKKRFVDLFNQLPSVSEFAAAALGGAVKRGWYRKSAEALIDVFGVDAPRFAALLAGLSPQTSVENNLVNALNVWKNWNLAGRPTDRAAIVSVMGRSVQGNKGEQSVLDAWINNSVRALSSEDPTSITLSGPKVNSFMLNLRGVVNEVTNDAWMANFALVDQAMFGGSLNAAGTDPGKGTGYLAMSAKVRATAEYLTKLTGDQWTPAEVQETVWSWAKTLYELQDRRGETRNAVEILRAGDLTEEAIAGTPDFATLLADGEYRRILAEAGYGNQVEQLARRSAELRGAQRPVSASQAAAAASQTLRNAEERAARRLVQLRKQRAAEAEAEKVAPKTAAQSAIDAIDKVSKGLSENSYSDPLFLTPLAKLALQIAKGLIQVGVAVDKAIRQAIAQARQQFPNDPTDDIQLADRLIRDAEYAAAVAAGDMETAQRMVDEAAVKAGYKTKGFHRTPKAFTKFIPGGPKAEAQFWTTKAGEFRTLFGQSGRAIWFGSSPENLPAYHNDSTGSGVVLEVYLKNPSPLQIDDDTRAWGRDIYADGSKQFPLLLSDEHIQSIRKDGYTGIEYWNNGKTADKSAPDEMVVFDANQIKSADPVTRDDEGNVVPLSQRFQSSTADIRGAKPDRVEAILKKVIAATDPKGKVFEAIAGLSNFVVFQATKIALRIYQATKSWVAARNAGMDYIKSHVQLSNEAETAANFEEHIKAFPNQEIPAGTPERPQPPSPSERVESRGIFRGDVTRDTDENWQSEARKWVDFYKGNLELAYQRFLGARIDNALREYVGGELLQRSELEVARAKNPIDLLRALDLQTRIAGSLVQAGSDFGKQGRARQLTFARYAWMVPQLVYRRLVNEQQKRKIPFPEIVAQQVREWLVESGQQAIDQVKEAMKQADNVFAREFKKIKQVPGQPGGPPIEIKWRDILTKSLQTQGSVRQKMLQVILADPKLRNLSPAGIAEITNLLTTAWEKKRDQIFRSEFAKKIPLPTVKADAREKLLRSLPRILKYANIARATPGEQITNDGPETFLLWDQAFRDAVAPEFGVAEINGLTARKLTELAQRAQKAQGVNRNEIIQEMFRMMARDGGVRFSDILRDYWYAAVLSGTRTQLDNALNILNGALNTVMLAVMAGKEAGLVTKSALKGLDEGLRDFWPMLWRGELYRSVNFNPDQPGNALEGLGESRNLFAKGISQAKYVSRLMLALDHVTAMMSDGAAKAYALNKEVGPEEARNLMLPDKAEVQAARDRAIAEGTRPDLVNKRTREILQESFPVDVLMTSKDIREAVTFTEVPQGLMGSLYEGLNAASRKFPALKFLTGTNFVRFAANYTNELLNYAAPIAAYRWYQSAPGRSDQPGGLQYSPARRDLLRAKAALGTALGATAAALFLGDDDKEEDRDIDITGSFKSLDPNKRKQLLAEGRQPYSIRVGDTYISYRQLGFGGLLGAIGELRDRQLFEPEKWNQEGIIAKVQDAATAGLFIVKDSSAISGLTEFLGFANAYKYDTNEIVEKSAPRYLARLGGSFVPNILKEVDAWSDPSIFKAEPGGLGHEYFLQQVPYARREIGPGPILNVLGEPVRVERYPYSRWVTQRSEDPAWNTLGQLASKGVFMPVPAITVKVNENGTRRELTREEKYQYQQAVGQGYRKFIEQNRERLLALPPAQASDFIDKNADRIRRNARTNLKNSF